MSLISPAIGQTVKLNNAPLFAGGDGVYDGFVITSDGTRVIFKAELSTDGVQDLYSASTTTAGTQIQLTTPLPAGNHVAHFTVSPDGNTAVYGRSDIANNRADLRRASTTSAGTESNLLVDVGFVPKIIVTSDGATVVFQSRSGSDVGLFSMSLTTPGVPLQFSSAFPPNESPGKLVLVETPGGTRAVYEGELNTPDRWELFSAPIDAANGQITLNSPPVAGGEIFDGARLAFALTADGSSVIYAGSHVTEGLWGLYKASTSAPGTQVSLSASFHPDGRVRGFLNSPLSNRVLYFGDLFRQYEYIVFEASTTGTPNQKAVYYPTEKYLGIRQVSLTPDEQHLIFRGSLTFTNVDDLYTAPTSFLFEPRRVTELASDEDVLEYAVSPDSSFLVYTQKQGASYTESTLWAVSSSGEYAPVKIGPVPEGRNITSFQILPDSSGVVYAAYEDGVFLNDLFFVPIPALDTVPNPIPAGPAAAIPASPGSTNRAPTLSVIGKRKINTSGKPVTIKGTATDDNAVVSVLVSYKKTTGSGKKRTVTKPARLTGGSWKFKFRARERVSKLSILSIDAEGLRSPAARVKVVRK